MSKTRAGRRPDQLKEKLTPPGKTYFLGIGINAYAHWPKLRNAVRDVEAIAGLLQTDFGLAPKHTHLLRDDEATEDRIILQLEAMADTVTDQDSLLIYYAGHGYLHRGIRGFWVPVDAPRGKIPRLIRNSTIRDYIGDIPSLHTLLISDSCFSGSLFVRGERREELEVDELATLPSRWAITSGRLDEPVADGPKDGHSPFAQSILDVLGSSARDRITANFLYEQVREQTVANGHQMPDGGPLAGVAHKRGQFVFRRVSTIEPDIDTEVDIDELTKLRQALAEKEALLEQLRQSAQAVPSTKPPMEAKAKPTGKQAKAEGNPDMIFIPGGTFEMGDVMGDNEYDDEKPVHQVTLSDFYLGRYAVTFAEYDAFCEATGRKKPGDEGWGRDRRPVINVSWYDAVAYCNWRSEQEGLSPVYTINGEEVSADWGVKGYRLPTEAEWEYAAREGGKKVRFGNGKDKADPKEINFDGSKAYKKPYSVVGEYRKKTVPVGSLNSPNQLGLHDMSGNVWEWCEDDWHGSYEGAPTDGRAWIDSPRGANRVLRGGGWVNVPQFCRAASRSNFRPSGRNSYVGFRLALS